MLQTVIGSVGVIVAVAVMVVSGVVNARYGMTLARASFDQVVMVAVACFADIAKAISWIFFAAAVARREVLAALASLLIFSASLSYAVAGALGFVALQRAEAMSGVTSRNERALAVKNELRRKETSLLNLGIVEPVAVVTRDLSNMKSDRRFASSKNCVEPTVETSRAFCSTLARRELDLEKASAAKVLEAEIAELRRKQDVAGGAATADKGDFQSALIAQLSTVEVSKIQLSLSLVFVVLLESGACFLLWLSLNYLRSNPSIYRAREESTDRVPDVSPVAPPSLPTDINVAPVVANAATVSSRETFADFLDDCVDLLDGVETPTTAIVAAYEDWCRHKRRQQLPTELVTKTLEQFCRAGGLRSRVEHGATVLLGVAIKDVTNQAGQGSALEGTAKQKPLQLSCGGICCSEKNLYI